MLSLESCLHRRSREDLKTMPLVQEVRHPKSLDLKNERKAVLLRDFVRRDAPGTTSAARCGIYRATLPSVSQLKRVRKGFSQKSGQRVQLPELRSEAHEGDQNHREVPCTKAANSAPAVHMHGYHAAAGGPCSQRRVSGCLDNPEDSQQAWLSVAAESSEAQVQQAAEAGATGFCQGRAALDEGRAAGEAFAVHGRRWPGSATQGCHRQGELQCPRHRPHVAETRGSWDGEAGRRRPVPTADPAGSHCAAVGRPLRGRL